jgi:histidinol phosphatase-like PHP family hydrolase
MHDEFAAAAVEHGTIVEANISATLCNRAYPETFGHQYAEYLAGLKERGVRLSLGSDCHSPQYTAAFERAAALLEAVGIRDEDLWRLPPRP